jgi:hypothetical protein
MSGTSFAPSAMSRNAAGAAVTLTCTLTKTYVSAGLTGRVDDDRARFRPRAPGRDARAVQVRAAHEQAHGVDGVPRPPRRRLDLRDDGRGRILRARARGETQERDDGEDVRPYGKLCELCKWHALGVVSSGGYGVGGVSLFAPERAH